MCVCVCVCVILLLLLIMGVSFSLNIIKSIQQLENIYTKMCEQ